MIGLLQILQMYLRREVKGVGLAEIQRYAYSHSSGKSTQLQLMRMRTTTHVIHT